MNDTQADVYSKLKHLGYPGLVAVRVASTPPLIVKRPTQRGATDTPRPGREIAESIQRSIPHVARALFEAMEIRQ